jgi:putative phosphoribosyl transferase
VAIIVDDGLATGLTMLLAIAEARHFSPSKVVVAVPVAPQETVAEVRAMVDEFVVLQTPVAGFGAIGQFYEDFSQVSDSEVIELIKESRTPQPFELTSSD